MQLDDMGEDLMRNIPFRGQCKCQFSPTRRRVLTAGAASLFWMPPFAPALALASWSLPSEVAGIAIPPTPFATRAAAYAQQQQPDYLFNHSVRTFLFGALFLKHKGISYDAELAFAAAAFHDFGLLPKSASRQGSFEIDGANAAEKYALDQGLSAQQAGIIWHGVEMHDGKWALTQRQGGEAMLVSMGAGSDVDGPDESFIDRHQLTEIVAAFPRLQFKSRFTALLIDHCRRKPLSQRSTWLEGLCRETVPGAWTETVEQEIAAAPFAE